MRRPFSRLTNFLEAGFAALTSIFIKPQFDKPRKKGPKRPASGDRLVGQPDPRVKENVRVLSERQSKDGRVNWLSGYNVKHHPLGIPAEKGLTYYRVREHDLS